MKIKLHEEDFMRYVESNLQTEEATLILTERRNSDLKIANIKALNAMVTKKKD
jgi:hypothetical protein